MNLYNIGASKRGKTEVFEISDPSFLVLAESKEKAESYIRSKGYDIRYSKKVRHRDYIVAATFIDSEYDT